MRKAVVLPLVLPSKQHSLFLFSLKSQNLSKKTKIEKCRIVMSGKLMMSLRLEEDDKNQPTSLASSQWVAQVFQCSALLCTLFGRAQFNSNLGSWVGLEISTRTTLFKRNYNIYFYVSKVILGNIFLLKKKPTKQNQDKSVFRLYAYTCMICECSTVFWWYVWGVSDRSWDHLFSYKQLLTTNHNLARSLSSGLHLSDGGQHTAMERNTLIPPCP